MSSELSASRVMYLAASGAGLLVAAVLADPKDIGVYSIAVAYGSIAATILQAGLDRSLMFEISAIGRFSRRSRIVWASRRLPVLAVLGLAAGAAFLLRWETVSAASLLVITRVAANDIEAIAIARGQLGRTSLAIASNGVLTGGLLPFCAHSGAIAMIFASASGNALESFIAYPVHVDGHAIEEGEVAITLKLSDAMPFALIAVLGIVYQRVDLAILGILAVAPAEIGAYALALRTMDTLVSIRGSIVQTTASTWARDPDKISDSTFSRLMNRTALGGLIFGLVVSTAAIFAERLGILSEYPHLWQLVEIQAVMAPLVLSHLLTSTWIYSRRGQLSTAGISATLTALSAALTWVAVLAASTAGAMVVTCAMEYISFVAFVVLRINRSGGPPAIALQGSIIFVAPALALASVVGIANVA